MVTRVESCGIGNFFKSPMLCSALDKISIVFKSCIGFLVLAVVKYNALMPISFQVTLIIIGVIGLTYLVYRVFFATHPYQTAFPMNVSSQGKDVYPKGLPRGFASFVQKLPETERNAKKAEICRVERLIESLEQGAMQ